MKIDIQNIQRDSGFTLIEMIVSLAIFTIVAVVAVGAFLKVIDANKKSQSLKTATNNINFALESMTREMRVGSVYTCLPTVPSTGATVGVASNGLGTSCASGAGVVFKSSKTYPPAPATPTCNLLHAYIFAPLASPAVGYTLYKAQQNTCTDVLQYNNTIFTPVISPDAIIDGYNFQVTTASNSTTGPQPRAMLRIKGHTGIKERNKTFFDVQTTISQRNSF